MSHLVLDSERLKAHERIGVFLRNLDKLKATAEEYKRRDAEAKSGDGDIPTNSLEAAMGKPLMHDVIIKRLQSCNKNLYFERSRATGRWGIYVNDPRGTGTLDAPFAKVRYLGTTIAHGVNPEFTPKILKDDGNLKSVEHGYRTVLARLLRQGLVTEASLHKHFGPPSRSSLRWQTATT